MAPCPLLVILLSNLVQLVTILLVMFNEGCMLSTKRFDRLAVVPCLRYVLRFSHLVEQVALPPQVSENGLEF